MDECVCVCGPSMCIGENRFIFSVLLVCVCVRVTHCFIYGCSVCVHQCIYISAPHRVDWLDQYLISRHTGEIQNIDSIKRSVPTNSGVNADMSVPMIVIVIMSN